MVIVTNLSLGHDKHMIWFAQNELNLFKANMTDHVKKVRFHISKRHTPSASAILGMEQFLTLQLTNEYKNRRGKLTKEVLKEARWQRAASRIPHNDVDQLARISAENSKWARERARAAALFLEQDQETEQRQNLQQL